VYVSGWLGPQDFESLFSSLDENNRDLPYKEEGENKKEDEEAPKKEDEDENKSEDKPADSNKPTDKGERDEEKSDDDEPSKGTKILIPGLTQGFTALEVALA